MYWEVNLAQDQKGYISILGVKPAPAESGGSLAEAIRGAVQQKRDDSDASNMRARSTVMGVRGLDESDETQFAGNVKPNLVMVGNLEKFQVPQKQVDRIGDLVNDEIRRKLEKKTGATR